MRRCHTDNYIFVVSSLVEILVVPDTDTGQLPELLLAFQAIQQSYPKVKFEETIYPDFDVSIYDYNVDPHSEEMKICKGIPVFLHLLSYMYVINQRCKLTNLLSFFFWIERN